MNAPIAPTLATQLLHGARCVLAVQQGRSLSDVLPAVRRFSNVVVRVPEISSCRASSFVSYSSWISGVSPTPGTVSVLVQASQVRCDWCSGRPGGVMRPDRQAV